MCKVGDKFIIEIGEKYEAEGTNFTPEQDLAPEFLYRIKGFNSLIFDENGLDKLEKCEENAGYEKGLSDAWEYAKKICLSKRNGGIETDILKNIFGTIDYAEMMQSTPQEAIEKLKEWEEKQGIKEGDYIISDSGTIALVQFIDSLGRLECLTKKGQFILDDYKQQYWKKTGKHIDLTEIFKGLEEEDEEEKHD